MAFDFPASPTNGQIYSPAGGPDYVWNSATGAWEIQTGSSNTAFVAKGGDTMTGPLVLSGNAVSPLHAVPLRQLSSDLTKAMAYSGMQINGSMDVHQRPEVTAVHLSGATSAYVIDGWIGGASLAGGTAGFYRSALTTEAPGYTQCLQFSPTVVQTPASITGGQFVRFLTHVEGYRFSSMAWGTAAAAPATIGFWVRAAISRSYIAFIYNSDGTTVSSTAAFSVVAGGTFQWVTVTIPGVTTGNWLKGPTRGAIVAIEVVSPTNPNLMENINHFFSITGFVMFPGTEAPTAATSPHIMRPYGEEIIRCQRYYDRFLSSYLGGLFASGIAWSTTQAIFNVLVRDMRSTPTVQFLPSWGNFVVSAVSGGSVPTSLVASVTGDTMRIDADVVNAMTPGHAVLLQNLVNADTFIELDARL